MTEADLASLSGVELHEKLAKLQYEARVAYADVNWDGLIRAAEELLDVAHALRDAEDEPNT